MSDEQQGSAKDAGKGEEKKVKVVSSTPENADGEINPAAPGETGTSSKE